MHELEPFFNWEKYYQSHEDPKSPFFGKEYDLTRYHDAVYDHYIHPFWDFMGSETLYIKILFADYVNQFVVIELIGEWNDTLHNDIMHLKRNILDPLLGEGIIHFILIGENVFNFHGSDDEYYSEWFDEVEQGWIVALNFPAHVEAEWRKYRLDYYLNFGGTLEFANWRTFTPKRLFELTDLLMKRRLNA
jgi:hypothetical protein